VIDGRLLCVDAFDGAGEDGLVAALRAVDELGGRAAYVAAAVVACGPPGRVSVHPVSDRTLARQFEAAFAGGAPTAVRTGILGDADQIRSVSRALEGRDDARLVVSPAARLDGHEVLDDAGIEATRALLFPRARVVALRAGELRRWTGVDPRGIDDLRRAAGVVREHGAKATLVSGFVRDRRVLDLLDDGGEVTVLDATRLSAPRLDGLSTAHATVLALRLSTGMRLDAAATAAQRFVGSRLRRGR